METQRLPLVETQRPWLSLYGIRVRPVPPFGSASSRPFIDSALIHRCLPDELLHEIFMRMTTYSLGRAACVCRKWRYTIRNPVFWRNACLKTWQVCYYRYIRFSPSGKFLYKNSSQRVKEVAKCMNFRASKADCVFSGHYTLTRDQVEAAILYPGLRPTVLRIRLRLRGTTVGANNRLDLLSLVTSGISNHELDEREDMLGIVEQWQDDETHNPDVPSVSHRRGLSPFVFVPFEEVETSVLNLPVDKMDYFVPG